MDKPWWRQAACADRDPSWWTEDQRSMWWLAVRLCLGCPVRQLCLADARAGHESGVVRGGSLFSQRRGRCVETSLVCPKCGMRPRKLRGRSLWTYCGSQCVVADVELDAQPAQATSPAGEVGHLTG